MIPDLVGLTCFLSQGGIEQAAGSCSELTIEVFEPVVIHQAKERHCAPRIPIESEFSDQGPVNGEVSNREPEPRYVDGSQ